MGEYAHRQITEVRSARFHISRRNFSALVNIKLTRDACAKNSKIDIEIFTEPSAASSTIDRNRIPAATR
jgi:hypothetical protein